MSTVVIFLAGGVGLMGAGVYGIVCAADALRRILALNIASVGVLTIFVALAARNPVADPVTHAMVLTGLVVAVSATGLALGIVRRLAQLGESEAGES
ncbi:MAG: NADH-quinone oxidoreductase subunit K [Gammaproteobacteria bacterium]|nr:NADH-quinone oxidoreductase subunit K [Gammaproteobacteria bacterium]